MTQIENPMARPLVEPSYSFHCERCHSGLFGEDQIFHWQDKWICDDCFADALRSMSLSDRADAMGIEVRTAADEE